MRRSCNGSLIRGAAVGAAIFSTAVRCFGSHTPPLQFALLSSSSLSTAPDGAEHELLHGRHLSVGLTPYILRPGFATARSNSERVLLLSRRIWLRPGEAPFSDKQAQDIASLAHIRIPSAFLSACDQCPHQPAPNLPGSARFLIQLRIPSSRGAGLPVVWEEPGQTDRCSCSRCRADPAPEDCQARPPPLWTWPLPLPFYCLSTRHREPPGPMPPIRRALTTQFFARIQNFPADDRPTMRFHTFDNRRSPRSAGAGPVASNGRAPRHNGPGSIPLMPNHNDRMPRWD